MLLQPFRNPLLDTPIRVFNITTFGGAADDSLKRRSCSQIDIQAGIEQVAIE
jgi:hypothetical protein